MEEASSVELGISHFPKKEVVVPDTGPNVSRLQREHPELLEHLDIKHTFEVYNPGKSEATIFLLGAFQETIDNFKKGRSFRRTLEELDDTVIPLDMSPFTFIPEYTAAQIEDLCLQEGIKKIKLVGMSLGGFTALELMADIKRNRVPLEISGLVTVVAPVSQKDLKFLPRLHKKVAKPAQLLLRHPALLLRERLAYLRSAAVRIGTTREAPYTRDELMSEIPVMAITTKGSPLFGPRGPETPDLLVDNRRAAKRLEKLFDNVEVIEVAGGSLLRWKEGSWIPKVQPAGAHGIAPKKMPEFQEKVFDFLADVDKEK